MLGGLAKKQRDREGGVAVKSGSPLLCVVHALLGAAALGIERTVVLC